MSERLTENATPIGAGQAWCDRSSQSAGAKMGRYALIPLLRLQTGGECVINGVLGDIHLSYLFPF